MFLILFLLCALVMTISSKIDKWFILREPYQFYRDVNQCAHNYHRYGANLANPRQDVLPLTMPDPNEGVEPVHPADLKQQILCNLKYGYW